MENQEQAQPMSEIEGHIKQADDAMQDILEQLQPKSTGRKIINALTCWLPVTRHRIRKTETNILRLSYSVIAANKQLIIILDAAEKKRAEKAMSLGLKDQENGHMYG